MSHQVVLLSGKQGSGKSTIQLAIKEEALLHGFSEVHTINFADALYSLHDAVLNTLQSKFCIPKVTNKDGVLLQLLGTEWGRKVYGDNIWVDIVKKKIEMLAAQPGKHLVVVADCRFRNEFDAFPEALRVRLTAPEKSRKERTTSWRDNTQHPSEIDLDQYEKESKFDLLFDTWEISDGYSAPVAIAGAIFKKLEGVEALV